MSTETQTSGTQPDFSDRKADAKQLYETSTLSMAAVAAHVEVNERTVKRWSAADGGWRRQSDSALTDLEREVAEKIAPTANAETKTPSGGAEPDPQPDERAAVLARHREETKSIRMLLAEALRNRDPGRAKMAVDFARALKLAQECERKSYGLDQTPNDNPVVVIDRT